MERSYIAIDLKSFYASVACIERGLDPMTVNLVVADKSRTEKTICLAVSPTLKAYGISGRARLFEVVQKVNDVNADRKRKAPGRVFTGESYYDSELQSSPELSLSYITAVPRMAHYIEYSTRIYNVYLKYVAPEDIHVYSIDEVLIDATQYLKTYKLTVYAFAKTLILDVLHTTGITATAGIGENLYLAKISMDIMAKRTAPDKDGVRIAQLDEMTYRQELWGHRLLTDFWRIGRGYRKKLEQNGLYTMGDIARCSIGRPEKFHNEDLLYKLFGINAELLIDHAWGWEPCTLADIKAFKPRSNSIGSGQVLHSPYEMRPARGVVHEMADMLALDLMDKGLVTDQMVLTVGYDIKNLSDHAIDKLYTGEITIDRYGRKIPKHAHGTANLDRRTSSAILITQAVLELFDRITDPKLTIRRLNLVANNIVDEHSVEASESGEQLNLFADYEKEKELDAALTKEKNMQKAILDLKKRYGKNAILKGMNFEEDATTKDRNNQIGGHKA